MFYGDNDGFSGILSWVCVFDGIQRKIEFVEMKEKKMKIKVNYFSRVTDVRDKGDEETVS